MESIRSKQYPEYSGGAAAGLRDMSLDTAFFFHDRNDSRGCNYLSIGDILSGALNITAKKPDNHKNFFLSKSCLRGKRK